VRFTGNVVIFPRIWGREPLSNISLQLVTFGLVRVSRHFMYGFESFPNIIDRWLAIVYEDIHFLDETMDNFEYLCSGYPSLILCESVQPL